MKIRNIFTMLVVLVLGTTFSCTSVQRTEVEPYAEGRPYTRWWWFASEISNDDILYQLEWLKDNGFGGVEIAWVYPMRGDSTIVRPAWLSKEWAAPVNYAKHAADSLGLGCDFTYGTLWPFSAFDLPDEYATHSFYQKESPQNRTLTWEHPRKAKILNHLDREAFAYYAARMNEGLKDAYKGSRSGVFVDSWEVETRHLWTDGFGEKFKERFGYAVEPYMDKLYEPGNEDVYYDYMTLMSDYVLYEFYKPFTDNAHSQGAFSRSQCGGAPADLLGAFMLVDVPETEAILYEPNYGRIPASAAALAGNDIVTSESFTCLYGWKGWGGKGPYQDQEQIGDMRLIADALFANGTNQIIWHGMPFNEKGKGKNDNHFYASVHVGPDSFFKDQLKEFNDYMAKVSRYMRKGRTYSDVAMYLPLEDSWMGVEYPDSLQMPWVWGEYELRYVFAPDYLKGYQPLWVNAKVLSQASFSDGLLRYGDMTFSALAVDVEWLDIETLRQVLRLAEQGLPVVMPREPKQPGMNKSGEYADLYAGLMSLANVSSEPSDILKQKPLIEGEDLPDFWCRRDGEELYIFVANPAARQLKYPLRYGQAFEDKGSRRELTVNTSAGAQHLTLEFRPNESLMLKVGGNGKVEVIDLGFSAKELLLEP